jgi:signal transduction histidine kinase
VFSESTRRALTGRWSIARDPYLFVAPTTIASVVLIEAITYTPSEIFGWFLASAIGYLIFCAILFMAHWTLFKNRETVPTPIWWIFALGLIAGVFKGVSTAWISYFYGFDVDLVEAIASRIFAAGLLGLIGVPAIAIVMNSLQEFREKRSQLIAEQVLVESRELQSQEVIAAMSEQLRISIEGDLDFLLEDLRESLEDKAEKTQSWQLIADNLRETARDSVRSISHRLWEKKSETVPDLTLIDIGRAMITTSAFPLRLILPILVFSAIPQLLNDHGVNGLWVRLSALCASTALVYKFAEILINRFPKHKLFIYVTALAAAAIAPLVVGHFAFGDPINAQFFGIALVLAVWLPMLTITCGLLDTALKQREAILDGLTKQIDKSRVRSISEDNETIRLSNDMAKYLHGNLQSRLMASAFAIEAAGRAQDSLALRAEIEKARQSVQTPFDQFIAHNLEPVSIELQKLLEMWDGILVTELNFAGSDAFASQSDTRNIIHIVEECFSNSLRHGLATEATIILITTETGMSLTVIDNGLGPREGSPGLGSSLFNSIAGSNWSLTRGPDGVGAQLNLQITK